MDDLSAWTPQQHIDRACVLLGSVDGRYDKEGKYTGTGYFTVMPPPIVMAQVHIELARIKMGPR
jgi:hypothetical protein